MPSLTRTELLAAADCAAQYPAGFGWHFLTVLTEDDAEDAAAAHLAQLPADVQYGWPGVIIASVRGDLSAEGIAGATGQLIDLWEDRKQTDYGEALNRDPQEIAVALRAWAAEMEENGNE